MQHPLDNKTASGVSHDVELEVSRYKNEDEIRNSPPSPFDAISGLSPAHKDYLIERHGTWEFDPIPGFGSADPLNFPYWKKITNLCLVAFHAMMSTFIAAALIPAFESIAKDLGITIQHASYLTSLQIAILGAAALFWRPFANRYGRRPIWLISTICTLICNVGCAVSPTFGSMAARRALVAFFICPASAIGSAVVTETFFKKERARYIGIWTLMVTVGIPLGPFIFGFVANNIGYRWIFWILAMVNGAQFILYLFFGIETRYLGRGSEEHHSSDGSMKKALAFRRIDPTPIKFIEFVEPLKMAFYPSVMIPAVAFAMVFYWANVLVCVETPALFHKFHFNPQQLGYQFAGVIIGSIIGEQLGGFMSDSWMTRRTIKNGGQRPQPEYRLWLSYSGFVLSMVGLVVFLVQIGHAKTCNVTPVVGAAIASVGNQVITIVMTTYAVDCHQEESASVGVFIAFVKQIWGFTGPFWFPQMFEKIGLPGTAGVGCGFVVVFSVIPAVFIHLKGGMRKEKHEHQIQC
ncbi:MFS general substrate transporter, partial [Aureobasidium melanogenum]